MAPDQQPRADPKPLVNVIIPTYNSSEFLSETLESALSQTYRPLEVVIADGGSTDRTLSIAEGYARRYPDQLRIVRADPANRSPCRLRNEAIDASSGPLLCWLDADDLWMPSKVEEQVEVMQARADVGLVYTRFEAFDTKTGHVLGTHDPRLEVDGDLLIPLFTHRNFIASCTAMYRRDVLHRRGLRLREKDFAFGDDYALWLALSVDWQAVFIPRVLARHRLHDRNLSHDVTRQMNLYIGLVSVQRELLREFPEARERLGPARRQGIARNYFRAARVEWRRKRRVRSLAYAFRAVVTSPLRAVRTASQMGRDEAAKRIPSDPDRESTASSASN